MPPTSWCQPNENGVENGARFEWHLLKREIMFFVIPAKAGIQRL